MENSNRSTQVATLFQEVMLLFRKSTMKVFDHSGITAPQGMVIRILSKEKTLKITELSSKLGLPNSTVSGIVDRLEKLGMIERIRSEKDRRVVHVSISPKFKDMHKNFHKQIEDKIEATMNRGTPEEMDKIVEGLETLKKLLSSREE